MIPLNAQLISHGNRPDRTITWRPWQQNAKDEFRFRTGDRYLGHAVWEHYLGFEQLRTSSKAIKLSMIRLGNEDVPEEAVIRPGSRYAIFKLVHLKARIKEYAFLTEFICKLTNRNKNRYHIA